jgi:hypothetical protein
MAELVRAGLATATAERIAMGPALDRDRKSENYRGGTKDAGAVMSATREADQGERESK